MATKRPTFSSVDEYILSFPPSTREYLEKMRFTIQKAAPKAEEKISYGIVGYTYHGMLVYFAAYKNHYAIYGMKKAMSEFKSELKEYKTSAATVQFSYDKPFPSKLITRIVKLACKMNLEKAEVKKLKKSSIKNKVKTKTRS